jgi:hypothetical protein
MSAPLIRILLRYLAGVLVAKGYLTAADGGFLTTDPDVYALVEMGLGLAMSVVTEGYYYLAKKFGWAT